MDQRSIYGLYSTITLGVQGTGMASFRALNEDERWALAFYVSNLSSPESDRQGGAKLWQSGAGRSWFPDLPSVATATASDVIAQHGDDGLRVFSYVRSRPDVITASGESPLERSARLLRDSVEAARRGQ
jgi:high-affinity iron transporter